MYSCMGETPFFRRYLPLIGLCAACVSAPSAISGQARQSSPFQAVEAQAPPLSASPKHSRKSSDAEHGQAANTEKEQATPPQFPTDAAPSPAVVNLKDGKLTIQANNSDLRQILQNLATQSGMKINGLNQGPRVFGIYGPGDSRDVLKDLLVGSGYNFIMVGDGAQGAPRELLLTPQAKNALTSGPVNPPPPTPDDADEPEPDQPQVDLNPPEPEPPGPGAIVPAPSPNSQEDETIRMQQTLQKIQHMQEQQQPKPPQ